MTLAATWVRRAPRSPLEELLELWHRPHPTPKTVLTEPLGACGYRLGVSPQRFHRDPVFNIDEPDLGDRCPECDAAFQAEVARL